MPAVPVRKKMKKYKRTVKETWDYIAPLEFPFLNSKKMEFENFYKQIKDCSEKEQLGFIYDKFNSYFEEYYEYLKTIQPSKEPYSKIINFDSIEVSNEIKLCVGIYGNARNAYFCEGYGLSKFDKQHNYSYLLAKRLSRSFGRLFKYKSGLYKTFEYKGYEIMYKLEQLEAKIEALTNKKNK